MDLSSLHTCTTPLHGRQNTGYTYALSSSYSSKALSYEKENKIGPLFKTPRMSRRSLRLHTMDGRYDEDRMADLSLNHSVTYKNRTLRKQKKDQQQPSQSNLQLLRSTPLKSQELGSLCSVASDTTLLSSLLDESSTLVDSFWGVDDDRELKERTIIADCSEVTNSSLVSSSGNINSAQTQITMVNDHICNNCNSHGGQQDSLSAHSSLSSSHFSSDSHSLQPSSTVYCRKNKLGAVASISNSWLCYSRNIAASVISIVTFLVLRVLPKMYKECKGHDGRVGCLTTSKMNGLLCDECKRKQHADLYVVHTWSSRVCRLTEALWRIADYTGKAGVGVFWWVGTAWYQLVSLVSVLNVLILTRCFPKLYRLLLLFLPLLLFLGVWHWGPSSLLGFLPINMPEWQLLPDHVQEDSIERWSLQAVAAPAPSTPPSSNEAERLAWLERQMEQLWEEVRLGRWRQDQLHAVVSSQHQTLWEQLEERTNRAALMLWISSLLEEKEQRVWQSSVSHLEGMLRTLETKTEEALQRQTMSTIPLTSAQGEAHHTLLAEVQRLQAELGRVQQDLQGVMGCWDRREQLDDLQDMVSAQVRQELQLLFYGPEAAEEGELPEPFLPWLSARFVSGANLQEALVDLEHAILKNVSLQLDLSGELSSLKAVADTVKHNAGAAGMSKEQVELIVKNALKLYSQDRTGLADYALESGGGSILSTRCSETFETKTALMSLFGLPLWYFSQSPRVVIQPDIHPGNCWAFKGSRGYLVIRLSATVLPTAFSLEHLPKALSPAGNISSAPRHFSVYGLEDEHQNEGKLLGNYSYMEDSDSLQMFPVTEDNNHAFKIIELRVLSNWGHPDYTCVYRFRVHGEPQPR